MTSVGNPIHPTESDCDWHDNGIPGGEIGVTELIPSQVYNSGSIQNRVLAQLGARACFSLAY